MKKLILLILIGVCILSAVFGIAAYLKKEHERRLNLVQNSFETGCYFEARNLCSMIQDDNDRGACYQDALDKCPAAAKQFRDWIENNRQN